MAKAKKKKKQLTLEEKLQEALVPKEEQPYEIPENWVWVRLGAITNINPPKYKPEIDDEELCSFLPMKAVSDKTGKIIDVKLEKFKKLKKGYTSFLEEDVLFAKITPCMENGKIVIAEGLKNNFGYGTTEFHVLRTDSDYFSHTLLHKLLRWKKFRLEASRHMTGSVGQRRVPKEYLENYTFPLAPMSEQKRIEGRLVEMTSQLDEAIQLIQEAKESFELRRASILNKAFTGELTAKWRENNDCEPAIKLLEKINDEKLKNWEEDCINATNEGRRKPKKPVVKSVQEMIIPKEEQPYEIPDGWEWVRLGDVCDRVSVGHVGTTSKYYCNKEEGIPFLRSQNVKPDGLRLESLKYITYGFHHKLKKSQLKIGDLLIVRVGANLGDACIVEEDYGEINCANIIIATPTINISQYLWKFFISDSWKRHIGDIITGTAQGVINTTIVDKTPFPLPPGTEMDKIMEELLLLLSSEENAKDLLHMDSQIELVENSILSKAFRGELGTNDPDDEPAMELLKKILEEKD